MSNEQIELRGMILKEAYPSNQVCFMKQLFMPGFGDLGVIGVSEMEPARDWFGDLDSDL